MSVLTQSNKVGKEEKKEVEKWQTRIKLSEAFRNSDNRKNAWKNMKQMYRSYFKEDVISVPIIYSHGRQMVPFLYFKNPQVECTPLQRDFGHKAKVLEAVDNMLLREMRVKEQLKLIIQDAFLYDYGIRKVGYDSEFGYDEEGTVWKELFEELGVELPEEELLEYNTIITKEFPFFLRVPPRRFLVDPDIEGPTLDTAKYVIEEFYRPLDDVLDDDRYDIRNKKDIKASHKIGKDEYGNLVVSPKTVGEESRDPKPQYQGRSDTERLRMWEVWDKEHNEVMVIADGYNGFLRRTEDVWGLDNFFPYDRLCFNPISDEHYSTSDAMYIEKQQLEYNDAKTQEMIHRRKENTKWVAKKNTLPSEEKKKFEDGKPGLLVEINGNPQSDIMAVTSQMSGDIYKVGQDLRNDIQDILALGKNQTSQELGKRKTAHEAQIIDQYAQLRSDERRDIVGDFIERAVKDVNKLIFKFWDTPTVIQYIGDEGKEWDTWTGEDLQGDYAISIVPNSTLPHTKDEFRKKVQELYQLLAGNPFVNVKELTRVLLDSYEEFDTDKLLLKQPGEAPSMADFRPGKAKLQDEPGQSMGPGSPPNAPAEAVGGPKLPKGGPGQAK
jgi:hypothetical protein